MLGTLRFLVYLAGYFHREDGPRDQPPFCE